ncbi:bacillithiol system redox-active protein YtxJ [Sphingobacterium faecale]|uniref:Bacillithiol system redox-active protein YtxJ n=1 Tax=Sphingobacterium faecale TaxID=2803775 RepID=A0ABS1R7W2_9SPHI|nr:bacillithiol system redox-active protein YtxJ [Sphingobacterium faecale]MBL1410062.1 bacillithiol system redox-active protein YtxJ [Sphingobacterium faecale]
MGFFRQLFSSNEQSNRKDFDWIPLNDQQQLQDIITNSYQKTIVIFKHSIRCSISRFVLNSFENEFDYPKEKIEAFYLDLIHFRDISNEIARRFNVQHQSPQILVIKNGKAVFSASHENIDAGFLVKFL